MYMYSDFYGQRLVECDVCFIFAGDIDGGYDGTTMGFYHMTSLLFSR